jgi:hypothetical protein
MVVGGTCDICRRPWSFEVVPFFRGLLGPLNPPSIDKLASTPPAQATRISPRQPRKTGRKGGAYIFLGIPPVGRTRSRTTSTQNTLVQSIQLFPICLALQNLAALGEAIALEVGFDGLVLFVEEGQVRDEVLDNVHVWEGVDFCRGGGVGVDSGETG